MEPLLITVGGVVVLSVDVVLTTAHVPTSGAPGAASWVAFVKVALKRAAGCRVVASLAYRPSGQLGYGTSSTTPEISAGTWAQNVAQSFQITVDLNAKTTSLSINGAPVAAAQSVPFYESQASSLAYIGFELGCTSAQTLAWDDVEIRAANPTIQSLTLASTTLAIGGAGTTYTATVLNPAGSAIGRAWPTLPNVVLQGWIVQGTTVRAAGGTVITCPSGPPSGGVLPAGTCTTGFSVGASNSGSGNGTLVAGSATFRLDLKQQGSGPEFIYDSKTIPVTLTSP